jgi:hypothetical protein
MADERAVQQRHAPMTQLHSATEHQLTPNQQPIIAREPMMVALMVIPPRVPIVRHSAAKCVEQSAQNTAVPSLSRMEHRNECAAKRQQQRRLKLMTPLEDVQ